MKRLVWFLVAMSSVAAIVPASSAGDSPTAVVGRVYYIEGDLLSYVPAENDWVGVVKDAPFSTADTFYSGTQGMAELAVPNGSWIRIGNSTQIQFISLDADSVVVDVGSGVARFYNRGASTLIKATSPYGYVLAEPGSVIDFYVGENSVELIPVKGKASFVHLASNARYDVEPGSPSIIADQNQVTSLGDAVDSNWDGWNLGRENFWASRAVTRGESAKYLPQALQDESYALEENGRWERVNYEGGERWFWRPVTISPGWAPFTVGRWTDWYGDQTWIPAEPFGYITHHYGNWVFASGYWYWAPPVVRINAGLPLLEIGFAWYPGRVGWIYNDVYVGWVPLAPHEVYYSHRHWGGPHTIVVNSINITRVNINVRNYSNFRHAVVVNQNHFYDVNNYRAVRVTNVNATSFGKHFSGASVVNNRVVHNYSENRQRFNYGNVKVTQKPHASTVDRITQNRTIIQQGKPENAAAIEQQTRNTRLGQINSGVRIQKPKITNSRVPPGEANRPQSEIGLQQNEIKDSGKGARQTDISNPPAVQPTQPAQVAPIREGVASPKISQPVSPKSNQPVSPRSKQSIQKKPTSPQSSQPQGTGKEVTPIRPSERPAQKSNPPAQRPATASPAKSSSPPDTVQPRQTSPKPERVAPSRPAQPSKPAKPKPSTSTTQTEKKKKDKKK